MEYNFGDQFHVYNLNKN